MNSNFSNWSICWLGLVVILIGLAACQTPPEEKPTLRPNLLSTIPANFTLPTATPLPLPLAMDDPRFPILPDPNGQPLYEAHCAQCHGINGEGQNPQDPYALDANGLAMAPPHNNSGHTWHHPDQQNFLAVWSGRHIDGFNPMPSFQNQLSADEIISILAYLKTWWGEAELQAQLETTHSYMGD